MCEVERISYFCPLDLFSIVDSTPQGHCGDDATIPTTVSQYLASSTPICSRTWGGGGAAEYTTLPTPTHRLDHAVWHLVQNHQNNLHLVYNDSNNSGDVCEFCL
uniref:Uncharacterized protein n=1 Tax=Lygus hesperus TaxID=30085 RepID=A0A0A9WH61_LYGHE